MEKASFPLIAFPAQDGFEYETTLLLLIQVFEQHDVVIHWCSSDGFSQSSKVKYR